MSVVRVLFLYFAFVILLSAFMGLRQRSPVKALLWILLLFVHIGGLYLLLNAEVLAFLQIIIYAGAILVLYLIMLLILDVREEERSMLYLKNWQSRVWAGLLVSFFFILGSITFVNKHSGEHTLDKIKEVGPSKFLGSLIFEDFTYPLIILAFLLLVPLLGIGLLFAKRRQDGSS